MTEWKEVKLQDVVSILGDGLHGTPVFDDSGEYYFINGNNLSNGKIEIKDGTRRTSKNEFNKYKKDLNERTIIVSINGTLGNVALYNNEKCILGKSACYFNVIENVERNFIRYLVSNNQFQEYISNFANGTTIKNVSLKTMREYTFLLPPLPEQRAIANVLSSLDDKIDLLHRQNKTLEAMAETLFRQWFVEEADEGWETVRVGDFVTTNTTSIDNNFKPETIKYLDTASINGGKIECFETIKIADAPSRARRIVRDNDILISTVRPNQKHYGIIKNPSIEVIVSTGFCVITCEKINPYFIYMLLTTDEMTEYLHSIAEGSTSTYPSLKPSDIEAIEFKLPPSESLNVFSKYTDNVWGKIENNYIQIHTLEKLRDTLLPQLMRSELRISI